MNFYLSYGAGIGSEALRLWLIDHGWKHEAVYVDHGGDWPETGEYVRAVLNLTIIKPKVWGYCDLPQYIFDTAMVPVFNQRWCTVNWKLEPLWEYFKKPAIVYIGYTIDEAHRITKRSPPEGITNHYPLVCAAMTRKAAIRFIRKHQRPVPRRSTCWFCPFQDKQMVELRQRHPDLYDLAKDIERRNMEARAEKGKTPLTLSANKKTVEVNAMEDQGSFW